MAEAKSLAARNGTSLHQFLAALIAERVGEMKAVAAFDARVTGADNQAALKLFTRVPNRAPLLGDDLPLDAE